MSDPLQDCTENVPDDFIAGPSFEMGSDMVDAMSVGGDSQQRADSDSSMASHGPTPPTLPSLAAVPSVHSDLDTFKMEYHPHSGCATSIETFSAFGRKQDQQPPIVDKEPWQPFSCRADFKFAKLAHNAALNKDHMDELLRLIWRIANGQAKLTFKSHRDVSSAWDRAAGQMTPFKKHTITVQHKREDLPFDVYTRPLWDRALDLLQDPLLAPHFVWDAQQLYKHDGTHYEHFFHEPWTADHWWNVQTRHIFLPWARSKLTWSSLDVGTYPVHIRNTDGLGGGRMVGWLLIVPDDSEEDGKLTYGFLKLLETIILYAKTGTNVFWQIPNSNPHETILQDHLHVYHIREWGKHLFGELKRHAAALGCSAEKKIDNHDSNKLQGHFQDDEAGYELLRCIASYLHINITIEAGKAEVLKFQTHLEMHTSKHIFDDIIMKGAARNFSTRPNEKQHELIKHWYLQQTNRKDIANQILELDHKSFVAEFIRSRIVNLTSLAQVEEDNRSNRAFDQFRKKLVTFLNHFLPSHHIPLPDGIRWLKISPQDQVHEHCYLKVHYESTTTWKLATDYLQCSPSFHGHERRDCALIHTQDKDGNDKNIFVKLLFVFKHTVGKRTLDLALVLPMDASPRWRLLDQDLQLTHLRAWPAASSEFITLHSIIHGALLVPDFDNHGDYFLVDYVDTDMFLRVQRNLI
ncbi:uncharacterized protein EDB91DRAFT_1089794 [Suillus paluster]|uniref:uncharacterized protein n=1 Tax=Suillus paluster TaxID=48578 RepID=UPI001B862B44|nr:uncharacterized protein EDB91DRAFT_1089794 [Suillus paluster]KAG1718801.1 hypothetical protein EDB91DRAFT_1089794 [Suillus paluster]